MRTETISKAHCMDSGFSMFIIHISIAALLALDNGHAQAKPVVVLVVDSEKTEGSSLKNIST